MAVLVPGECAGHAWCKNSVVDAAFQNGGAGDFQIVHGVVEGDESACDADALRGDDSIASRLAFQQGCEDVVGRLCIGVLCDLDRLIARRSVHGAADEDVFVLDLRGTGSVRSRKADRAVSVGAYHRTGSRQQLPQVVPAVIHRQPAVDVDGCHSGVNGIRKHPADDVRQNGGKRHILVQAAVVAAFCDQADAGHAGEQILVFSGPLHGFQILP